MLGIFDCVAYGRPSLQLMKIYECCTEDTIVPFLHSLLRNSDNPGTVETEEI